MPHVPLSQGQPCTACVKLIKIWHVTGFANANTTLGHITYMQNNNQKTIENIPMKIFYEGQRRDSYCFPSIHLSTLKHLNT